MFVGVFKRHFEFELAGSMKKIHTQSVESLNRVTWEHRQSHCVFRAGTTPSPALGHHLSWTCSLWTLKFIAVRARLLSPSPLVQGYALGCLTE